MKINITKNAMDEIIKSGIKNVKIFISGYGWAGPSFGLVQGEPKDDDIVQNINGVNFSLEKEISEALKSINIDFTNGWLRKGFTIYADGFRGRC